MVSHPAKSITLKKHPNISPLGTAKSQRQHKEPLPCQRRLRQSTSANVDLQRLMQQFGLVEPGIALSALFQESLLGQIVLQVAVAFSLISDAHERHGLLAGRGRVVVTRPDLDVVR